jgi:hypothetical protein
VLSEHEQALGYGVMYVDTPFVLWLTNEGQLDADRYSGGVRLRSQFGTVLDIAVWHGIEHVTETGDVAPGLPPFRTRTEDEEGDEE